MQIYNKGDCILALIRDRFRFRDQRYKKSITKTIMLSIICIFSINCRQDLTNFISTLFYTSIIRKICQVSLEY